MLQNSDSFLNKLKSQNIVRISYAKIRIMKPNFKKPEYFIALHQ